MNRLRIGGVPEYFNLPILLAIENGDFAAVDIHLEWIDIPEGTGRMTKALAAGDLDLAIALTEGISKSIVGGNPSTIIHEYVNSPLIWGVHRSAANNRGVPEFKARKFAISRYGSGSHLMAILYAEQNGVKASDLVFEVVNNLQGAQVALAENPDILFLWEKYTTQPLVDRGEFFRVDEFPTPWPCFVLAASNNCLRSHRSSVRHVVQVITESILKQVKSPTFAAAIANRYGLKPEQIAEFLPHTTWNGHWKSPEIAITKVFSALSKLDLFASSKQVAELWTSIDLD